MDPVPRIQGFMSNLPNTIADIISKQTAVKQADDYFAKVEKEIKYFEKYGTFKIPESKKDTETNSGTVLNENIMKNVPRIKLERISEAVPLDNEVSANKIRDSLKENIKIEKPDMPPPQMPLKKNKKTKKESSISSQRTTRSTVTKGNQESTGSRDSDIVLQKPVIETFTLSDSDDENERIKTKNQTNQSSNSKSNAADVPSTRTTRTKTRAKNQTSEEENPKRSRSPSTDVEKKSKPSQSERKTKRKKSEESPPKEQSVYEDAESTVSNNTEVTSSDIFNESPENKATQRVVANETVVINTPKVLKPPMNMEDIMTDDEDDNITVTVPKKVTKVIGNSTKAIFSPFEGSPVKKRVEAFERLGAEISTEIPVRTTRTKTKALKERNGETAPTTPVPVKDKEKKTPQMANRYLAALSNSTSKAIRTNLNESVIPSKSASALKASQMEYREREMQRREKEMEAIKKREAQIQAQIEEKKKKRLEKQMKAQQTREALEKTKIRTFEEIERSKEEKRKQVLAGKHDKIRKIQEETERKRAEALRRAMEERKKEEERRRAAEEEMERLKQQEQKKAAEDPRRTVTLKKKTRNLPIYMRQKAPLLPTEDCYDSDDGRDRQIKKPTWTSKERAEQQLRVMKYLSKAMVNHFFQSNANTPDLRDIFEYIDPNKLKRTSSAIWKVAPRFTMMPETIAEDGEE